MFLNGMFFALLTISAVYYFFPSEFIKETSALIIPFSLGWLAKTLIKAKGKTQIKSRVKSVFFKIKKSNPFSIFKTPPKAVTITALVAFMASAAITIFKKPDPAETEFIFGLLDIANPILQSIVAAYIFALIDIYKPKADMNKRSIQMVKSDLDTAFDIFNFQLYGTNISGINDFKDNFKKEGLRHEEDLDYLEIAIEYLDLQTRGITKRIREHHPNLIKIEGLPTKIDYIELKSKQMKENTKYIKNSENNQNKKPDLLFIENELKNLINGWDNLLTEI